MAMPAPATQRLRGHGFEVTRTPPEERQRRKREAEERASSEMAFLTLKPFCSIPRMAFDDVKIGKAAVRRITIQNPGKKQLKVSLTPPKTDMGFELDYISFVLPGQQEAVLRVGWVPQKPGNVRSKIDVKYGSCFAQILVVGSCPAPIEKASVRARRAPLVPNNFNNRSVRGAKSNLNRAHSGKKEEAAKKPSVPIPENPVLRCEGEPEFSPISLDGNAENAPPSRFLPVAPTPEVSWSPQPISHLSKSEKLEKRAEDENVFLAPQFLPPHSQLMDPGRGLSQENLRRETFVKDYESLRRETFVKDMSYISSTPAPNAGASKTFAFNDVSAIKTGVPAGVTSVVEGARSAEKCSTSRELKFDDEASGDFGHPQDPIPASNDEQLARRETFLVESNQQPSAQNSRPPPLRQIQASTSSRAFSHYNHQQHQTTIEEQDEDECQTTVARLQEASRLVEMALEKEEVRYADVTEYLPETFSKAQTVTSSTTKTKVVKSSNVTVTKQSSEQFCFDTDLNDVSKLVQQYLTEDKEGVETTEVEVSKIIEEQMVVEEYIEQQEEIIEHHEVIQEEIVEVVEGDRVSSCPTTEKKTIDDGSYTIERNEDEEDLHDASRIIREALQGFQRDEVNVSPQEKIHSGEGFAAFDVDESGIEPLEKSIASPHFLDASNIVHQVIQEEDEDEESIAAEEAKMEKERTFEKEQDSVFESVAPIETEDATSDDVSLLIKNAMRDDSNVIDTENVESPVEQVELRKTFEKTPSPSTQERRRTFDLTPSVARPESASPQPRLRCNTYDKPTSKPEPQQIQEQEIEPEVSASPSPICPSRRRTFDKEPSLILDNIPETPVKETNEIVPEPKKAALAFVVGISPPKKVEEEETLKSSTPVKKPFLKARSLLNRVVPKQRPTVPVPKTVGSETFISGDDKSHSAEKTMNQTSSLTFGPNTTRTMTRPSTRSTLVSNKTGGTTVARGKSASAGKKPKPAPLNRLTLIKPMRSDRKTICHPNPFASKNMYYDERWIQKQESGFTRWLNFILTPDTLDDESAAVPGTVDVAKLWKACSTNVRVPRAPTREVLSMRAYTIRRQMNRLRRQACMLWQAPAIAQIITRVEIEIEKKRLIIRKDRDINKDVGMKKSFLELLLNYNPLWLKIGLETVYGEVLAFGGNDVVGLSRFIVTRMLSNPDIAAEYAHPSVPHSYRPGYDEARKQFTLKKFLQLVFFLDQAKKHSIIKHDPCLFCKDSKYKMSKDLLTSFSRDFLAGEGDVTKHLAYLEYKVDHKQTPLDEFDFAVTNFAVDLKDGIRLCRTISFLTMKNLNSGLRIPANSRLQKIHNVELALSTLKVAKSDVLPADITAKSIVDGHMEKTLSLMWHILFGFQLDKILDEDRLTKEIGHLTKSLQFRAQIRDKEAERGLLFIKECQRRDLKENMDKDADAAKDWANSHKIQLLLRWARLVCAHYGIEVENMTVSFSDGRCLCFLLHHYYPSFLQRSEIQTETTQNQQQQSSPGLDCSMDDSFGAMTYSYGQNPKVYESLLNNEKKNFKMFYEKTNDLGGVPMLIKSNDMSNTIPDQKVTATFLTYLAARLLDLSEEMKAARTIQLAWRKYHAKIVEKRLKVQSQAARVLQKHFRNFLMKRRIVKYSTSALVLQRAFRKVLSRRALVKAIEARILAKKYINSAIVFQKNFRMIRQRREFLKVRESHRFHKAAIKIQSFWRMKTAMREFEAMKFLHRAAIQVQAIVKMGIVRKGFLAKKKAAISIQSHVRGTKARKTFSVMKAEKLQRDLEEASAVTIQKNWRRYAEVQRFNLLKQHISAATKIQSIWRMHNERRKFVALKTSIITIQSVVRSFLARKVLVPRRMQEIEIKLLMNESATKIQKTWKMFAQRKSFLKSLREHKSAMLIQAVWKMHQQREHYMADRRSIIMAQSVARMFIANRVLVPARKADLARQKLENDSAVVIQKSWKMYQVKQIYLRLLQEKKRNEAATQIQSYFKMCIARRAHLEMLKEIYCAIKIQALWRGFVSRRRFLNQKRASIVIQSFSRGFIARKIIVPARKEELRIENERRSAATTIQKNWRMIVQKREHLQLLRSIRCATLIQSAWKMYTARKTYLLKRRAIVKMQSVLRVYIAKKILVPRRLSEIEQLRKENVAATSIQKTWKMIIQQRKFEQALLRWRSAIKIQAKWRMYTARKQFLSDVHAIILVQSLIRRFIVVTVKVPQRKLEIQRQEEEKTAAIAIQSFWRMKVARRAYMNLLEEIRRNNAATQIQAYFKMYSARKSFAMERQGIIKIQSVLRMFIAKRVYVPRRLSELAQIKKENEAATMIQKSWKMIIQQKRFRQLLLRWNSAIKIQAQWRMKRARKQFLTDLKSIIVAQSCVRRFIALRVKVPERKMQVQIEKHENECATKIQASWKMHAAKNTYLKQKSAAIVLQAFARGCHARRVVVPFRKQEVEDFNTMVHSAIVLQKNWRRKVQVAKYQNFLRQIASAIKIQTMWRMHRAKKEFKAKHKSTVVFQSLVRGFLARRIVVPRRKQEIEELKRRIGAATKIQKTWKMFVQRKMYLNMLQEHNSAVKIQAYWRMFQGKKAFVARKSAAIVLQSHLRKLIALRILVPARKAEVARQEKERVSAIAIQKNWRRFVQQKIFKSQRQSTLTIQTIFRGYIARAHIIPARKAKVEEQKRRNNAAITFQKVWRMRAQVKKYKLMLLQKNAATKIQTNWRMAKERKAYLEHRRSTILIQSVYRGFIARSVIVPNRRLDIAEKKQRNAAAILIQKTWKMHVQRKKFIRLLLEHESANKIKSVLKMFILQKRYLNQRRAAIAIQSFMRGSRARNVFVPARREEVRLQRLRQSSAVLIQKNWKMFTQRKSYLKQLAQIESAIKIQKTWRMYSARKSYLAARHEQKILLSVISIQRFWRRYRARKAIKAEKIKITKAATVIQSCWKTYKVRKVYRTRMRSIVLIQSVIRRYYVQKKIVPMAREEYKIRRIHRAATIIQKYFRGYRIRKAFMLQCQATKEALLPEVKVEVDEEFGKKIEEVRQKVKVAKENATEDKKLCNRTSYALDFLYTSKDMAQLIQILKDIDTSTRFSSSCCDQLIAEGDRCLKILLNLVRRCNRSVPHMEIISLAMDVFLNLAKYETTHPVLESAKDVIVSTIVDVMVMYKDKSGEIFCKGASVLWTLSQNPEFHKFLLEAKYAQKLKELWKFFEKKNVKKVEEKKRKSMFLPPVSRTSAKRLPKARRLSVCPAWNIREDVIRHHSDSFVAIQVLAKSLNIK